MNLKKIFEGKKFGFYVLLASVVLTLLTGIVYTACYVASAREYNLAASILLFFGFGISLVLVLLNKVKFLPYILGIINLAALLCYIQGIYLYVSEVFIGIDSELETRFIIVTLLYALTYVANICAMFMPIEAKAENTVELKKSLNVLNTSSKATLVAMTTVFGVVVTGAGIARANRTAISNELDQPLFEVQGFDTNVQYYKSKFNSIKELFAAGEALNEKINNEGIVLLDNKNNALPLKKEEKKVTVFGYAGAHASHSGRGSSNSRTSSKQLNLKDALKGAGFELNEKVYDYYYELVKSNSATAFQRYDVPFVTTDTMEPKVDTIGDNQDYLNSIQEYGDAAIYVITRSSGENSDVWRGGNSALSIGDEDLLSLSTNEKSILDGLMSLKKQGKVKKVILVLNGCNQIAQKEFEPYDIDASLWIGNPGINGLKSLANVLNGTVNPSGRLPDTFWYDHGDNPVMNNYGVYLYENASDYSGKINVGSSKPTGYTSYMAYQEGIYVGYRYAETRYTDKVNDVANVGEFDYDKTIYRPFGYGQSYTTFALENQTVTYDEETDKYTVSVTVRNTGSTAGKYSAQVYLQKPYTKFDTERQIEKSAVELVGFEKTDIIEPNGTETLDIVVDQAQFASYDRNVDKTFILTEGDYLLTTAENAHEAAKNFLQHKGKNVGGNADFVYSKHLAYDKDKYSKSEATGKEITNLFDEADINKSSARGDNSLQFMSRSNWSAALSNTLRLNDKMVEVINSQQSSGNLKKDDGEYPTYGEFKGMMLLELKDLPFDDPKWDTFMDQLTWEDTVEVLRNGLQSTAASNKYAKPRTYDDNGPVGITQRYSKGNGLATIKNDPDKDRTPVNYAAIPVLAATFNKELAKEFGNMVAEDALWAGINGLYGLGMNTHRTAYSGRNWEYYSEDPILSGLMATEQTKAVQAKGLNAYIKHIALNDQELQRFGIGIWTNEQALREIQLRPFEICIKDGKALNAMTSLTRFGLEFAPGCSALNNDWMRGECGLEGVVVTDMYTLGYLETSMPGFVSAGCDIPDGELDAKYYDVYREGYSKFAHDMRLAAKRVFYHTVNSSAMNGFTKDTKVVELVPQWEVMLNIGEGVTIGLFAAALVFSGVTLFLTFKAKKEQHQA